MAKKAKRKKRAAIRTKRMRRRVISKKKLLNALEGRGRGIKNSL